MVTYPIDLPTSFGISEYSIGLDHAVGVSESEFSFDQQVQEHEGTAWEITVNLELLTRDQFAEYNAFILMLGGRRGTFMMAIPGSETPRGVATGTPLVDGTNQTGTSLNVKGFTPNVTGIMKVGDWFQIGTGDTSTLHQVVADADSDLSGKTTLEFQPKIVIAPDDEVAITVQNAKGHFRLKSNLIPANVKPPNTMSISFAAREVKSQIGVSTPADDYIFDILDLVVDGTDIVVDG